MDDWSAPTLRQRTQKVHGYSTIARQQSSRKESTNLLFTAIDFRNQGMSRAPPNFNTWYNCFANALFLSNNHCHGELPAVQFLYQINNGLVSFFIAVNWCFMILSGSSCLPMTSCP
jgi:hypothetical protein